MLEPIEIRGHHLSDVHIVALLGIDHPDLSKYVRSYTPEMSAVKLATLRRMVQEPETHVKIVASIDYICELECPNKKPECFDDLSSDIDEVIAKVKFGFKLGEVYSAGEILEDLSKKTYRDLSLRIEPGKEPDTNYLGPPSLGLRIKRKITNLYNRLIS